MDTKLTKIKYSKLLKFILYILTAILLFLGGGRIFLFVKAIAVYDIPEAETYHESYLFDRLLYDKLQHIRHYAQYVSIDEDQIQKQAEDNIEKERQRAQQLYLPIEWLKNNEPSLFWLNGYNEYVSRDEFESYAQDYEDLTDFYYDNTNNETNFELTTVTANTADQNDFEARFPDAKYNDRWSNYMQEAMDAFVGGTGQDFEGRLNELSPELIDSHYDQKLGNPETLQESIRTQTQQAKDFANNQTNLKFALVNRQTNKIYSNFVSANSAPEDLPEKLSQGDKWYFYYAKNIGQRHSSNDFQAGMSASLIMSDSDYDYYFYLPETLAEGDIFYKLQAEFDDLSNNFQSNFNGAIILLALAAAMGIFLIVVAGRKSDGSLCLLPTDKLYNDLHFLLSGAAVAGLAFICIYGAFNGRYFLGDEIIGNDSFIYSLLNIGIPLLFALAGMILLEWLVSVSRNLKNDRLLKHSLFYKALKIPKMLIKKTRQAYRHTKKNIENGFGRNMLNLKKTTLLAAAVYVAANLLLIFFTLIFAQYSFFIFLVCVFFIGMFNLVVLFFLFKSIQGLDKIMSAARSIRSGNLQTGLIISELPLWQRSFAKDILDNQEGLRNAVADAIRNERMKAELITNVSHDLKTPLTSIVSYVNLLKKRDIEDEEAQNYIDILDEKAERLKRLIEDLVEASKASTGNLPLNPVKIDLYELAMQAIGENSDDLELENIECRINEKIEDIAVWADSQRTWRIIDNLFSNAKKYALTGTRIYIDITAEGKHGVFTMKNISKDALNVPVEELTQRFVRGDVARGGEGSGLGLSIAKSLCELQGGSFDVEIDGDLFKAIIRLPLSEI